MTVLTSANLAQLKDLSALDGWGMFFFFRDGPSGAPGGGGTPPMGGRPGGGGGPPGGGGGGGGGGIMPPGGGGGGGGPIPPKAGMGGGGRGPPGGPGVRGGPPGTTAACLCRERIRPGRFKMLQFLILQENTADLCLSMRSVDPNKNTEYHQPYLLHFKRIETLCFCTNPRGCHVL